MHASPVGALTATILLKPGRLRIEPILLQRQGVLAILGARSAAQPFAAPAQHFLEPAGPPMHRCGCTGLGALPGYNLVLALSINLRSNHKICMTPRRM